MTTKELFEIWRASLRWCYDGYSYKDVQHALPLMDQTDPEFHPFYDIPILGRYLLLGEHYSEAEKMLHTFLITYGGLDIAKERPDLFRLPFIECASIYSKAVQYR